MRRIFTFKPCLVSFQILERGKLLITLITCAAIVLNHMVGIGTFLVEFFATFSTNKFFLGCWSFVVFSSSLFEIFQFILDKKSISEKKFVNERIYHMEKNDLSKKDISTTIQCDKQFRMLQNAKQGESISSTCMTITTVFDTQNGMRAIFHLDFTAFVHSLDYPISYTRFVLL